MGVQKLRLRDSRDAETDEEESSPYMPYVEHQRQCKVDEHSEPKQVSAKTRRRSAKTMPLTDCRKPSPIRPTEP